MKTVLCFGNPDIKEDSLALELASELVLKGFKFARCTNPELLLEYKNKKIIILDTVKNLKEVKEISIKDITTDNLFTTHDFDLGYFLKILKKIGTINKIKIIGIPQSGNKEKIKEDVIELLRKM